MNIGDIVVVIGFESLPESFLGRYGVITDVDEYKVGVEFYRRVGRKGSFVHSAFFDDLLKIGETNY